MACVFGEMSTLKTGSRWSPKSVLFGEKEKNACAATTLRKRVPWESRHEGFTKVCPRATLRIARTLQSLCWQVLHQDAGHALYSASQEAASQCLGRVSA